MAPEKTQNKAPKNKTLTLTTEDIETFQKSLLLLDDLKKGADFINKIILGDCLQALDFLPDEFADLIIIDPPYNLTKDFNGQKFNAMNDDLYEKYLASWFFLVAKKLKKNGTLYMCGDYKCSCAMERVIKKELTILNRITWQREKGRGAAKNFKNSMEDIWFAVKNPKDYYFDMRSIMQRRLVRAPYKVDGQPKDWTQTDCGKFRDTCPSNFWDDISVPFWSMKENTPHPTQKPEKLYAKLILASSKKDDVVFDPFSGSGTSSVVAKKLGRKYVGIELDKEYALMAEKRLASAENDNSIQGYRDGVFWERNTANFLQK